MRGAEGAIVRIDARAACLRRGREEENPRNSGNGWESRKDGSGTHLLPWGCHTIMELVLAALPVETTGALLRTGATAEIAAILIVGVECGKEWRNGGGDRFFIPLSVKT